MAEETRKFEEDGGYYPNIKYAISLATDRMKEFEKMENQRENEMENEMEDISEAESEDRQLTKEEMRLARVKWLEDMSKNKPKPKPKPKPVRRGRLAARRKKKQIIQMD